MARSSLSKVLFIPVLCSAVSQYMTRTARARTDLVEFYDKRVILVNQRSFTNTDTVALCVDSKDLCPGRWRGTKSRALGRIAVSQLVTEIAGHCHGSDGKTRLQISGDPKRSWLPMLPTVPLLTQTPSTALCELGVFAPTKNELSPVSSIYYGKPWQGTSCSERG